MRKSLFSLSLIICALLLGQERVPPEIALVYPAAPAAGTIKIDGELSDTGWGNAVKVSSFTDSGSPELAVEQTCMQLAYDKDSLYIAVVCNEKFMDKLETSARGRDAEFWFDDSVEFFLDQEHTHSDYYQFAVTAGGASYENRNGDALWSRSWDYAVKQHEDRWVVEVKLPFSIFERAAPVAGGLWGFNLCRERRAGGKHELFNWADVGRVFNRVHLFGHLLFMPDNWDKNSAAISRAQFAGGRMETHLLLPDGFYLFNAGSLEAKRMSYSAACMQRFKEFPPLAKDYLELKKAHPGIKGYDKMNQQFKTYAEWYKKSLDRISAMDFAQANVFYLDFNRSLENEYWRFKLALIDKRIDELNKGVK